MSLYPSDYYAGRDLGRAVAAEVIAKARADGSSAAWTGTVPTGPCKWTGTNPGNVTGPTWKTLLLSGAGQFRPPTPPACDSPQVATQVAEIKSFSRVVPGVPADFPNHDKAFYWQSPEGLHTWPYRYANTWIAEDRLDQNHREPGWKFTYWYIRPHQLDSTIVPLFPVPNFPSYPSNHSTVSATRSEILAELFPTRAAFIRAVGKEAGDSRIWAGIHYQMDNIAGVNLGRSVAQLFKDWADHDGSQ